MRSLGDYCDTPIQREFYRRKLRNFSRAVWQVSQHHKPNPLRTAQNLFSSGQGRPSTIASLARWWLSSLPCSWYVQNIDPLLSRFLLLKKAIWKWPGHMKYTLDIYSSIASSPFTWKIKSRYLKIYTTSRSMDPCYDLCCVTLVATLAMMAPESIHSSSMLTLLFRRLDLCSSLASLKGPRTRKNRESSLQSEGLLFHENPRISKYPGKQWTEPFSWRWSFASCKIQIPNKMTVLIQVNCNCSKCTRWHHDDNDTSWLASVSISRNWKLSRLLVLAVSTPVKDPSTTPEKTNGEFQKMADEWCSFSYFSPFWMSPLQAGWLLSSSLQPPPQLSAAPQPSFFASPHALWPWWWTHRQGHCLQSKVVRTCPKRLEAERYLKNV